MADTSEVSKIPVKFAGETRIDSLYRFVSSLNIIMATDNLSLVDALNKMRNSAGSEIAKKEIDAKFRLLKSWGMATDTTICTRDQFVEESHKLRHSLREEKSEAEKKYEASYDAYIDAKRQYKKK